MSIEGILQADELFDYLYGKMRGARGARFHTRVPGSRTFCNNAGILYLLMVAMPFPSIGT